MVESTRMLSAKSGEAARRQHMSRSFMAMRGQAAGFWGQGAGDGGRAVRGPLSGLVGDGGVFFEGVFVDGVLENCRR